MDVLPEPNDAAPFLTRIPYLPHCSWEPWATEGFLAVPVKYGFLDRAGKFKPQHDTSNMASLLQAWLFFGVLAEKIGRAFKAQDFVKQDELGQDFITLAPLKKRKVYCGEISMEVEMEIQLKTIDFRPSSLAHLPHVCDVWHSIMWLYEVLGTRSFKDALQICSLQMSTKGSAFGDFNNHWTLFGGDCSIDWTGPNGAPSTAAASSLFSTARFDMLPPSPEKAFHLF